MPGVLQDWISRHVPGTRRLEDGPLFQNPRSGQRYAPSSLRRIWVRACRVVGIEGVSLYEGTKHSMATDAIRRGVSEPGPPNTFLGHADVRSTRRYARLSDGALVSVLRPGFVGDLSVDSEPQENPEDNQEDMVEAAGFEPAASSQFPAYFQALIGSMGLGFVDSL